MLVSARPAWRHVLPQIGWPLLCLFIYSIGVTLVIRAGYLTTFVSLPDLPLSSMGAALGIFLAFRTNSAYDRWWEARILWGQLVNLSRSLVRQADSFTRQQNNPIPAGDWVRMIATTQIIYAHALRTALRQEDIGATVRPYMNDDEWRRLSSARNIPRALLHRLGLLIGEGMKNGLIDGFQLQRLDETLSAITDVQGGCERIKNTPIPRQYDLFPEFFTYVYCLLLPLGLVGRMGLATALVVVLIAFVFLATNRIGHNIENPFEGSPHDTPMTALSTVIENDLRQALNEPTAPELITPRAGVLM